jgi:hypothetical protein
MQREINILRINKEGKSFFSRENQLFRNNGLLGGATIDFFAADRQKFGDARIDTALADTIIALQLEGKQAEVFQTMQHILGCILCVVGPTSAFTATSSMQGTAQPSMVATFGSSLPSMPSSMT